MHRSSKQMLLRKINRCDDAHSIGFERGEELATLHTAGGTTVPHTKLDGPTWITGSPQRCRGFSL